MHSFSIHFLAHIFHLHTAISLRAAPHSLGMIWYGNVRWPFNSKQMDFLSLFFRYFSHLNLFTFCLLHSMLNTFALSIFIPDPFSVATIETGDLIPSDVYQSLNESLELKCLLNAHIEKINEVKSKITIFSWCFFFSFITSKFYVIIYFLFGIGFSMHGLVLTKWKFSIVNDYFLWG